MLNFIGCFCKLDSLNFSFFLREKVEDGHGLQLDLTYRRTIRNRSKLEYPEFLIKFYNRVEVLHCGI